MRESLANLHVLRPWWLLLLIWAPACQASGLPWAVPVKLPTITERRLSYQP